MKRRAFIQSLGAVALAPSIPLSGLVSSAASATAAPAATMYAGYTPFMQANALAILRHHETLEFGSFVAKTGLNPAQAEAMLKRFAKSGWIKADGIATIQAIKPQWIKDIEASQSALSKVAEDTAKKASDALRNPLEESQDAPPKFTEIKNCCAPDNVKTELEVLDIDDDLPKEA